MVLFSIDREETIAQQIVDIPNLRVLDIDKEGEKLLVGMLDQRLNEQGKPREYFHWLAIWNTTSGSLDQCLTGSCIGKLTDPDQRADADIGAVMGAETVVAYDEFSYSMEKLSPKVGADISLVNSPEADYWWHIGKIAINSHHNQLAIAFEEGRIDFEKINGSENWPLKGVEVLEQGDKNQLEPVQFALIDPSGNWLSIIRGKNLSIWNVGGWIKKGTFNDQIDGVNGMNFNPSGELLFIATDDHIRIIGLKQKKIVFEMQTPGIKSLNISDDNRLLFWGDENGTVHVWGLPIR